MIIGCSLRTLEDWRRRRVGPQFIKCGRLVRYRREAVERWFTSHTVTTDPAAAAR
jgi:predicted DNA-binding transcriptional regulator AlpA